MRVGKFLDELLGALEPYATEHSTLHPIVKKKSEYNYQDLIAAIKACRNNHSSELENELTIEMLTPLIDVIKRKSKAQDNDAGFTIVKSQANAAFELVANKVAHLSATHPYDYLFYHLKNREHVYNLSLTQFVVTEDQEPIDIYKCFAAAVDSRDGVLRHTIDSERKLNATEQELVISHSDLTRTLFILIQGYHQFIQNRDMQIDEDFVFAKQRMKDYLNNKLAELDDSLRSKALYPLAATHGRYALRQLAKRIAKKFHSIDDILELLNSMKIEEIKLLWSELIDESKVLWSELLVNFPADVLLRYQEIIKTNRAAYQDEAADFILAEGYLPAKIFESKNILSQQTSLAQFVDKIACFSIDDWQDILFAIDTKTIAKFFGMQDSLDNILVFRETLQAKLFLSQYYQRGNSLHNRIVILLLLELYIRKGISEKHQHVNKSGMVIDRTVQWMRYWGGTMMAEAATSFLGIHDNKNRQQTGRELKNFLCSQHPLDQVRQYFTELGIVKYLTALFGGKVSAETILTKLGSLPEKVSTADFYLEVQPVLIDAGNLFGYFKGFMH